MGKTVQNPPVALIAHQLISELGLTLADLEFGDPKLIEQLRLVAQTLGQVAGGSARARARRDALRM